MNQTALLLLISYLSTIHTIWAQSEWEIDKLENGICVYTRHEENSDFKAFKATMQVKASIDEVVSTPRRRKLHEVVRIHEDFKSAQTRKERSIQLCGNHLSLAV